MPLPLYDIKQNHQTGFTLIEMLVVLIITAMVSGIIFQALESAYRLQDRFATELFKSEHGEMAKDWYRQSVQGLLTDYPDGKNIFRGKSSEFSGLSSNPLSASYGVPTAITWRIKHDKTKDTDELVYIEGARKTTLIHLNGSHAHFVYFDEKLSPNDSWPPPLGLPNQIPKQIQLQDKDTDEAIDIVAVPMGPRISPMHPQNIFGVTN